MSSTNIGILFESKRYFLDAIYQKRLPKEPFSGLFTPLLYKDAFPIVKVGTLNGRLFTELAAA